MIDPYYRTTPTVRAYGKAQAINVKPSVGDEESRRILSGRNAHMVQA